jgi:hypothetical protein
MIKAVGLRVEYEHDPDSYRIVHGAEPPPPYPEELRQWWRFLKYGLPPLAGGQLDQPAGWFDRCHTLSVYHQAYSAWVPSDRGAKWRKEHLDAWPLAQTVEKLIYGE